MTTGPHPLIRLGALNFSNAIPVYHALELSPQVQLIWDTPAGLNQRMADGQLAVSLVSSAYYLKHQSSLRLLDGLSISSGGPVESVLLISAEPWPPKHLPDQIYVTEQSETSVALLRILLAAHGSPLPDFKVYAPHQLQALLEQGHTVLVIGDQALSLQQCMLAGKKELFAWDLATAWHQQTGLPMVFAVWVARRDWAEQHPDTYIAVHQALITSRDRFFADPTLFEQGVQAALKQSTIQGISHFNRALLTCYWTECLCYTLTPHHHQSLRRFGSLISASCLDRSSLNV